MSEEGQIPALEQPTDGPWVDASKKTTKKRSRKTEDPTSSEPLFATTEEEV